jgi:putative Mg2+ transporter-C (MgtC) family protein
MSLGYGEIFLRLAVAVVAGAVIGLDRELRRKPAGLRTQALVSLGSAVFVLETIDSAGGSSDMTSRVASSAPARSSAGGTRNRCAA